VFVGSNDDKVTVINDSPSQSSHVVKPVDGLSQMNKSRDGFDGDDLNFEDLSLKAMKEAHKKFKLENN